MKNISDYDFSRISAFIDGELDAKEINCLIADMQTKPELKDLYFSLLELSEVSENLKPLGFKERLSKLSLQDLIAAFTQRVVMPITIFSCSTLPSTMPSNPQKKKNSINLPTFRDIMPKSLDILNSFRRNRYDNYLIFTKTL